MHMKQLILITGLAFSVSVFAAMPQGVEELPGIIDAVKAEGADLIVVQSELGMSQNIEIVGSSKNGSTNAPYGSGTMIMSLSLITSRFSGWKAALSFC